jgi:hypothetical protein
MNLIVKATGKWIWLGSPCYCTPLVGWTQFYTCPCHTEIWWRLAKPVVLFAAACLLASEVGLTVPSLAEVKVESEASGSLTHGPLRARWRWDRSEGDHVWRRIWITTCSCMHEQSLLRSMLPHFMVMCLLKTYTRHMFCSIFSYFLKWTYTLYANSFSLWIQDLL